MTTTIFAVATAGGRGAVAVVRISGPGARSALAALGVKTIKPRIASLRRLIHPSGDVLDDALILWFPGPRSYTGEDCAELHLHGGRAVIEGVLEALEGLGLEPAAQGAFTRRAFEHGKMDLGQAEAVADLIDAESAAQARQALAQLSGALGARHEGWRWQLLAALASLEAAVDFPDEEVPPGEEHRAKAPLERIIADIDLALVDGARGRRVRDGYRVAILGAPNAGKSSLLNAVAGRDAAIVTPVAGSTRDVIEAHITLEGHRVILADTAGLRPTVDWVETEGVRRAEAQAQLADLRLWVIDQSGDDEAWRAGLSLARSGDLCILNKADLRAGAASTCAQTAARAQGLETLAVSLANGEGGRVLDWLADRVLKDLSGAVFPATTRERHATLLTSARDHLARAVLILDEPELAAEDVRLALRGLAMVTGSVGAEDVLGEVFANFCIGK